MITITTWSDFPLGMDNGVLSYYTHKYRGALGHVVQMNE